MILAETYFVLVRLSDGMTKRIPYALFEPAADGPNA
jgi:hypothetical protein